MEVRAINEGSADLKADSTGDETVDALYRAILRRPPDEEGRAVYLHLLRAGKPVLELVKLMMNSPEFFAKKLLYQNNLHLERTDSYDLAGDQYVTKYLTPDVLRMNDRIQNTFFDYDTFNETGTAALSELEGSGGFHTSQVKYLQFHRVRFYEICRTLSSILSDQNEAVSILDFGYSVNSLVIRRLFPMAKITVADRPGIRVPKDKFDAVYPVDLLQDHLSGVDLGPKFDVILFSEVIEHLQIHPVNVIQFLLRQLKTDGQVMLTTPNLFSHGKLRQIAQRKSPLPVYPLAYTQADSPHFHFREYGMSEMLSMIDAAGGQITAFFFSACWDEPSMREALPPHELGNMFLLFQRKH